uniref:G_PROTEIN_RECEP_F1_2 domain-containing protein n=1 Tax=Onchocerca volvulus TaxID=6282 RepID=A0A8R1TMP7_ONCVO
MDDHVITNGTNSSTSMMGIKLWAFAIFSSFLLYSLIANIILFIVLYKNESISVNRTFTYVSLQLIICSFISYIPQVAIVLPETLYEDLFNEYKTSFIYRFGIFTQIFAFFAVLIFLFLLALTRYVFFNLSRLNYIFTGTTMHLIAAFMWLVVAILTISDMHFCEQEFNGTRLQWIRKYDGSRMGSQLKVRLLERYNQIPSANLPFGNHSRSSPLAEFNDRNNLNDLSVHSSFEANRARVEASLKLNNEPQFMRRI